MSALEMCVLEMCMCIREMFVLERCLYCRIYIMTVVKRYHAIADVRGRRSFRLSHKITIYRRESLAELCHTLHCACSISWQVSCDSFMRK